MGCHSFTSVKSFITLGPGLIKTYVEMVPFSVHTTNLLRAETCLTHLDRRKNRNLDIKNLSPVPVNSVKTPDKRLPETLRDSLNSRALTEGEESVQLTSLS
jgi:hypothetical protein